MQCLQNYNWHKVISENTRHVCNYSFFILQLQKKKTLAHNMRIWTGEFQSLKYLTPPACCPCTHLDYLPLSISIYKHAMLWTHHFERCWCRSRFIQHTELFALRIYKHFFLITEGVTVKGITSVVNVATAKKIHCSSS